MSFLTSWKTIILLPVILVLSRQLLLYLQDPTESLKIMETRLKTLQNSDLKKVNFNLEEIVIAAVSCGGVERLGELSVMLKSAVLFSQTKKLKFLIFTDNLSRDVEKLLKHWQKFSKTGFSWDIRPPLYPPLNKIQEPIKNAFAPCATQRLFFPQILPEYKAVLYVDTDIIFLQDPYDLWKKLNGMEQKSFGLVTENNDP